MKQKGKLIRANAAEVVAGRLTAWLCAVLWLASAGSTLAFAQTNVSTLNSLAPNTAPAGTPGLRITVNGRNFNRLTVVRWNGADRTTDFISTSVLMFDAPAADLATAGTAQVTAFNPGLDGGVSNALPFTITQPLPPTPILTAINPNSATAGGPPFTLIVTGANFINTTVVRWNGAPRPTTFVSATQLTAQIPASDIANPGTATVTVFTPPNATGLGGGSSTNALPFTINQPANPVPTLTSLNPNQATAGGAAFTLMATGTNFINNSVVRWNGANRPTTFISATQLTAQIPATDIANAGAASVTVFNPPNTSGGGGGTSNPLPFTINQPPAPVPTLTNLNPNSATAGGAGFMLTVTGTNFINTSAVLWNGMNRPTMFISATQLSAQIPASDLANAGAANITVFNPPNASGGGGASNALQFTITLAPAPLPNITSINPNTANAGGAGFALMVTGTNFINTSVVRWNGADRQTMFISATQLIAQIPAADIANPGTANVSVFNPPNASGGGGASRTLPFTINQAPNPLPTLTNVTPNPALVGAPGVTLTLTGANFVANSVVRWNGANRPTMFVSTMQLTAQIPASDLASAGTASLTVFNPAPGGGLSNALTININNPAPVITSIIPNSVVAGSPAFTLTVNGNGFIPASVVRWNGAPRPTTFVNGNQLAAQIPATDVPAVGTAQISVANPAPGGGLSPGVAFTITPQPLPPPVLNYVAASAVAQGARQVRLTLTGKNFRPGARVVIGQSETNPALMPAPDILVESVNRLNETTIFAIVSVANNAVLNTRAVDVINADNSNTSARGSATTQPLRVQGGTSLGAPLQITTVLIVHPRTGTILTQGEPVFAEAVLGGAGTGTIIGQWLWDGNVFEQFALHFTAGERKLIRTNNPLPTAFLGPHRLEIKITSPNLIQSPPIEVIVNNGTWKLLRLIDPVSGAGFVAERPPHLRWTLVPGAMKYQVGFSAQPFFNTITRWHDVAANEWQVPLDVWTALPFGELWWTVRVVETSGNLRQPAELRRIYRLSPGALQPVSLTTPTDTTVLAWQPVRAAVIYRVTITSDAAGKLVLRRFATANAKVDVKSLADKFQPGVIYHWRVEAYSLKGRLIYASERYSFVPKAARTGLLREVEGLNWQMAFANQAANVSVASELRKQPEQVAEIAATKLPALRRARGRRASVVPPLDGRLASASLPPKGATPNTSNAQTQNLSDLIAARTPQPNQTVATNTPPVAIDFNTPIKPSEVVLVLDDTDYSALAQINERRVAFTPTIPLNNGQHQVILVVGLESIGWFFNVLAAPRATQVDPETQGTDAEKETQPTATANEQATVATTTAPADPNAPAQTPEGAAPTPTVEKEFTYEGSANTQSVSGQEQDTNNLALAMQGRYRNGAWLTEMNGNGLLNSLLSPNPRHVLGRFNDYILRVARQSPNSKWGADLRFGMISPLTFQTAEYVSTGFAREGLEASVKTPAGNLGFYRNTNDKGQGEGVGFGFRQQVFGGSYDAPTFTKDPERVKFRLMWLSARDVGGLPLKIGYDDEGNPLTQVDAFATPRVGDSYGALLSIKLNKDWTWLSEYALTSNNVNRLAPDATRQFGRAWRTGFIGTWKRANLSLAFRDVSPNYAIPATASLTQLSASDRRGLDFSISRDTRYGNFGGIYQYLQSDFRYDDRAHVGLHNISLNWSKQLTQTTTENATYSTLLSVGLNQARTTTSNRDVPDIIGLADQRRDGVNISVTETMQNKWLGTLALTVGGSRNWFRDNVNDHANNLITSLNFSGNWSPRPFFQWNSNLSINWMAGERFSVGGSRTVTTYIQPTFIWARTGLSLIPLVTINRLASQLELLDPLGARMKTGDMWASNAGGRLAWQLPGKLRFNTLSFEASQAWMRDGLSGMRMNMPRYLFLWTLVQPSKPAPPREEKQAEQPQQQPAQPAQPAQKSGS